MSFSLHGLNSQLRLTFLWVLRDRVLHAVLGVGGLLILLVPVVSGFSMRQVQESAIALALSSSSFTLLSVAALLGSAAIYRDVDRRYTTAVLGLPVSRYVYLLGRFFGIALFLVLAATILCFCSSLVIYYAASTYPSSLPIPWGTLLLAFIAITFKAILLASLALLFSSVSTSFSLPFFCSIGIYLAGSASQEVYEYVTGSLGGEMSIVLQWMTKGLYYLLPNFSGLNFQLQAVYALPLNFYDVLISFVYAAIYTSVVAWIAALSFARRELP